MEEKMIWTKTCKMCGKAFRTRFSSVEVCSLICMKEWKQEIRLNEMAELELRKEKERFR